MTHINSAMQKIGKKRKAIALSSKETQPEELQALHRRKFSFWFEFWRSAQRLANSVNQANTQQEKTKGLGPRAQ